MVSRLAYKILQLFFIMLCGFVLTKSGVIKSKDSMLLSKLSLYLFMPAIIINAFNIEKNEAMLHGLILSFSLAFLIHIILLIVDFVCKKFFKSSCVERASIVYSNAGNLIIPIVSYVLGEEWIVYSCGYLIVQLVFIWTHGVRLFSENERFDIKKILLNVNMIVIIASFVLMFFGISLPEFATEVSSSLGGMLAPAAMITAGMFMAEINFKKTMKNKRVYFAVITRLLVCPLVVFGVMNCILPLIHIENADKIMLIAFLASSAPAASTVMQFSQLYKKDEEFAVVVNIVSTLACVVTMPLLVWLCW